jgi:DNA-directed RNA polymerase specialized sigma24 family protein/FixJ family two-component response regulator
MSTAQLVVQHLPYLRRYARALTGSQVAGDAYVAATLETLVNEPETLGRSTNVKADLFRVFTRIWNSLSVNGHSDQVQHDLPAEVRLGQITPLPRQAFLLSCLEGFSEEDAGVILDVDVNKVRDLVDEAGRELAADMATEILIIEDEPLIAMDLEALVEGLGHNVIGVARTRSEAVKIASESKRPGLILADIQLADGSSGLDAVNDLLKTFEVPVIFITAYPERFLTGERPEPAFLIAKPFQPANVSAVISQALFSRAPAAARRTTPEPTHRTRAEGAGQRGRRPFSWPATSRGGRARKNGPDHCPTREEVPADAQGECGEDQVAGCFLNG